MSGHNKSLYIIIALFILLNLCFVNKAFHIDDHYTITITKAILDNPFRMPVLISSNPAFLGYYYAPFIKIFGESEPALHLAAILFTVIAIMAFFSLCKRFCKNNLLPVLFLISTPAFIVTSQSITNDMPVFALMLSSLAIFIYAVDSNRGMVMVLAAILAGITMLIKYTGVLLLPLFVIYGFSFAKEKRKLLTIAIPLVIFSLWNIYTMPYCRRPLPYYTLKWISQYASLSEYKLKALACLSFLSGTSIITLFITWYMLRKKGNLILFLSAIPIGMIPFLWQNTFGHYALLEKIALSLLFVSSATIILIIGKITITSYNRDKETFFLGVWFFISLIAIILFIFIAARFILLALPPMFLLIYREISPLTNLKRWFIAVFIALSLIISTAMAIGDYRFANVYREFTNSIAQNPKDNDTMLLFYGADWGYNYYVIKNGYKRLLTKEVQSHSQYITFPKQHPTLIGDLSPGSFKEIVLIMPMQPVLPTVGFRRKESFFKRLSDLGWEKMEIRQEEAYLSNIFLHHAGYRAGFYSHHWGLLPFNFRYKAPLEVFKFFKLKLSSEID